MSDMKLTKFQRETLETLQRDDPGWKLDRDRSQKAKGKVVFVHAILGHMRVPNTPRSEGNAMNNARTSARKKGSENQARIDAMLADLRTQFEIPPGEVRDVRLNLNAFVRDWVAKQDAPHRISVGSLQNQMFELLGPSVERSRGAAGSIWRIAGAPPSENGYSGKATPEDTARLRAVAEQIAGEEITPVKPEPEPDPEPEPIDVPIIHRATGLPLPDWAEREADAVAARMEAAADGVEEPAPAPEDAPQQAAVILPAALVEQLRPIIAADVLTRVAELERQLGEARDQRDIAVEQLRKMAADLTESIGLIESV